MEEIMNLITELIYDPARFINNEVEYRKEIEDKINKYKDEAINFAHSSTKLPVDKLQELIDETYTWQVQDLDADTLEDSLKLGIREGALVVKHYFDKK